MQQSLKLTKMNASTTIATRLFNTNPHSLLRHISTAATATAKAASKEHIMENIYKVGSSGDKVSDVLHRIITTGEQVNKNTLFDCFKELRKNGRYQQCLEIIDWFEKDKFVIPERNFTLRISILHKLKGLAEAEKYFDSIPSFYKSSYVYGSLLSCYCADLETDKALATFKTMDEMGFASNIFVFNNILNLYVKTKQLEKVPELISEMKKKMENVFYYANVFRWNFAGSRSTEVGSITFDENAVDGSDCFRYLGSINQKDGELDGDVTHRFKAEWLKWKSATGFLCDKDMPQRLKGKFYRTTIRPALLYGSEC